MMIDRSVVEAVSDENHYGCLNFVGASLQPITSLAYSVRQYVGPKNS